MRYGIFYDDQEKCVVDRVEVDAPNLATAIFLAGMQVAHNGNPIGPLEVVRAEVPAGWTEIELP